MRGRFTLEEHNFLLDNYSKMSIDCIAKKLGRSKRSIYYYAYKHQIRKGNRKRFTLKDQQKIIEMLEQEHTIDEVAKEMNRSKNSIVSFMTRHHLQAKVFVHRTGQRIRGWSPEEEKLLIRVAGVWSPEEAAKRFDGRSTGALISKIRHLGSSWMQGTISCKAVAKALGLRYETTLAYLRRLRFHKKGHYMTDYDAVQAVAQAILDNPRAAEQCRPSFKHLEACARGEVIPEPWRPRREKKIYAD